MASNAIFSSSVDTHICLKQLELLMVIILRDNNDKPLTSTKFLSGIPLLPPRASIKACKSFVELFRQIILINLEKVTLYADNNID